MASFCYSLRCFCSGFLCCRVLRLLTYPYFSGTSSLLRFLFTESGSWTRPSTVLLFPPRSYYFTCTHSRISASRASSSEGCKDHEQVNRTAVPLQELWALNLSLMLGCRDCEMAPSSSLTSAAKPVSPSVSPEHQLTGHRAALIFTMSHHPPGQPFSPCPSRSSVC